MIRHQRGTTTVEFAILGSVLFILIFGVIEIGRAFFVWNSIGEVTRRGARLAAVCPVNHGSISKVSMFNAPNGGSESAIFNGLTDSNIDLQYLDEAGNTTNTFTAIKSVRVGITGYQHRLLIPFFDMSITVPDFSTTIPAESLGYIPELGERQCFGS
ncbi:MAG: TadE/TadG family type IV pilus assembly protein [Gammaproteobacteria bacterium]